MVGFPMLSGFISKLLFAASALESPEKMLFTLIALVVSTILNAVYFLRLVITLYSKNERCDTQKNGETPGSLRWAVICFILLNLVLGLGSQPIVNAITKGLEMFG